MTLALWTSSGKNSGMFIHVNGQDGLFSCTRFSLKHYNLITFHFHLCVQTSLLRQGRLFLLAGAAKWNPTVFMNWE